jgi:hypothetical protein
MLLWFCDSIGDTYFSIKKVFYGPEAKKKAIELAIKFNIEELKERQKDAEAEFLQKEINILKNPNNSSEKNLEEYIQTLDYSGGNFKYESSFYDIECCDIEFCK